jgi:hypothetical protein
MTTDEKVRELLKTAVAEGAVLAGPRLPELLTLTDISATMHLLDKYLNASDYNAILHRRATQAEGDLAELRNRLRRLSNELIDMGLDTSDAMPAQEAFSKAAKMIRGRL